MPIKVYTDNFFGMFYSADIKKKEKLGLDACKNQVFLQFCRHYSGKHRWEISERNNKPFFSWSF